ncbi:MAG: hypothetical protein B7Y49_02095 [Sphingomonas sp. 28-62-11]|nr:MAG: hypothetical protein B7Y49_02095 [Sphingomonas sp. 28-62-11]
MDGAWTGWTGDTVVKLANGTVWRQQQYYYRYRYKYRPRVIIDGHYMHVEGMSKAVRVRRIG